MLCSCTGDVMNKTHLKSHNIFCRARCKLVGFTKEERAAALVEFAILLPIMLLVFAVIIEGSRLMISFQTAIGGVRDATRYLSRVVPTDICTTGGSIAGYTPKLQTIIGQSMSGNSVLPTSVVVTNVLLTYNCVVGAYRLSPAPVATVTATVEITFPFVGIFGLNGSTLGVITTDVTDSSRIFGV